MKGKGKGKGNNGFKGNEYYKGNGKGYGYPQVRGNGMVSIIRGMVRDIKSTTNGEMELIV